MPFISYRGELFRQRVAHLFLFMEVMKKIKDEEKYIMLRVRKIGVRFWYLDAFPFRKPIEYRTRIYKSGEYEVRTFKDRKEAERYYDDCEIAFKGRQRIRRLI